MRETGYRVYSNNYKKYLDTNGERVYCETHHLALRPDGKLYYANVGIEYPGTLSECPILEWEEEYEDCVVERDTGIKDKNGKKIYEGDIVNLEYYEKPFGKKHWRKTYPRKGGKDINIVVFGDGYFKFYEEDKYGVGSELSFSDYGEWESKNGAYKYVAEVIGNIHEDAKLLEKGGKYE